MCAATRVQGALFSPHCAAVNPLALARALADDIRSGALVPGERLPSERDLARTLEVIRASVREALASLALQGVVETRHGAGTFVVGAPPFGTEVPVDVNAMLPGRRIVGLTLGDSETQTLIPVLVDLVVSGRLPLQRLITHY